MLWRLALVALFAVPAFGEDKRPATKDEVAELRASVKELREQVAELRARVDALIDAVNGGPAPAARDDKAQDDAVKKGMRDHKIAVGMTLAQVQQLAGSRGRLDYEADSIQRYKWDMSTSVQLLRDNDPTPLGSYALIVEFENGKVVAFRKDASGGIRTGPAGRYTR